MAYPDKFQVPGYVLSRGGIHKYDPINQLETTEIDNTSYRQPTGKKFV